MKTLYLLRHAKTERGNGMIADKDRKLLPRGREACKTLSELLTAKSYLPALVLTSPAVRTEETLALLLENCDINPVIKRISSLYLASGKSIIETIRKQSGKAPSVMVIGHNPGMHDAALMLASHRHNPLYSKIMLHYPTSAFAALRFDSDDWHDLTENSGELLDFITPNAV